VLEEMVHDLRELLRVATGRTGQPTAVVIGGRTLQSTSDSVHRAGSDGKKRSEIQIVVDTLGHLLALHMTPADRQDRTQVKWIAKVVQCATGRNVELAYVDQSFTGEQVVEDADDHGFSLQVVTLPQARSGFVLLPRRWVIERTFAGMARLRRLAKDFERLPKTVEGPHLAVFACIMLARNFAESA
jgi:transposase